MGAAPTKFLVVNDEPQICSGIDCRPATRGFGEHATSDGQEAKALLASSQFDVLIADTAMPVVSWRELLAHAKRHPKELILPRQPLESETLASIAG